MATQGKLYGCPVEFALDLIGGKWKMVIIARLKQGPMRYSELRRSIPALTDKMLTQRLHELEDVGFIAKGDAAPNDNTQPYRLTDRGASLAPALTALYEWGEGAAIEAGARFLPPPSTNPLVR